MLRLPDMQAYRRMLQEEGAPKRLPTVPRLHDRPLPEAPGGSPGCWPWSPSPTRASAGEDAGQRPPRITIVTPSYQQGPYLEATIRSVLQQDYPNLEYIVLDGGSTDASLAILEKYRPHLSYVRCARDKGQSHAINLGFSLGTGDVFAWLNSDDCYLPQTLEKVAEAWRRGGEFIYGDHLEIQDHDTRFTYRAASCAFARYLRRPGLFAQPSAFWSGARHVPIWEDMVCAMDYELWVRLLPGLRQHYVPTALSVTRAHAKAKTHSGGYARHWEADADRNFAAHPELFASNRLLELEQRLVQKITRLRRSAHIGRESARVAAHCGWSPAINPSRHE